MPKDTRPSSPRPAFPKYEPVTGTNLIKFLPPGGKRKILGYAVAPDGADPEAEILGDVLKVQAKDTARIYDNVPRADIEVLHGKKLMKATAEKDPQPRRRRPRAKSATLALLLLHAATGGEPRTVYAGPASLRAVPKPSAPPRSDTYRKWIGGFACIGCPSQKSRTEAHHHGRRGVGEKCSDYRCVPLCVECHRLITNTYRLPGRSRAETERLIAAVQLDLHDAWMGGAAGVLPIADGRFLRPLAQESEADRRFVDTLTPPPPPVWTAADFTLPGALDELHRHLQGVPHAIA